MNKAQMIKKLLKANPEATAKQIKEVFEQLGSKVTVSYINAIKRSMKPVEAIEMPEDFISMLSILGPVVEQ